MQQRSLFHRSAAGVGLRRPVGPPPAGLGRLLQQRQRRRAMPAVRAVAAPTGAATTATTFALPKNASITVEVTRDGDAQRIRCVTDLEAGRLLLHWGLEGGKGYKGGWRLAGEAARPDGTRQYKDRALQSPFRPAGDGRGSEVRIMLAGDEASDALYFVLKDDATGTWYDHYSTNFSVPLRAAAREGPPEPPRDLCDTWAWMKWDAAGRPQRSTAQANAEYDAAVAELEALLRAGRPLDELRGVARGEVPYSKYHVDVVGPLLHGGGNGGSGGGNGSANGSGGAANGARPAERAPVAPRAAPAQPLEPAVVAVPDALVAVQAYVMWEDAGRPQGADFGAAARDAIEHKLRAGMGLREIEAELQSGGGRASPPAAAPSGNGTAATTPAAAAAPPPQQPKQEEQAPPPPPTEAEVGQSLGAATRNPMAMIKKTAAPALSEAKRAKEVRPLDFLVQRAAVDGATRWRRVYQLGGRAELLAVVKQQQPGSGDGGEGGGPVTVDLTTDAAFDLVLHWGVTSAGSRDWQRPPKALRPPGTEALEGGTACETEFEACDEDECDVEVLGAKVPLQRVSVTVPAGAGLGGLTFVLRSGDGTRWYRDAERNFFVPLPSSAKEGGGDGADGGGDGGGADLNDMQRAVVEAEVHAFHWTLMHRYHKAADVINEVLDGFFEVDPAQALADVYTWLRYSATRQLTWQRNYNTQPRILSAAQERLTRTIAEAHGRTAGEAQEWVRMMLTTVGRGGDGQRIRDEILHIMHRNKIPELKGTWMEEWHQKLHNNTTPDDVPICAAYLAFLEAKGDEGAYWRVLSDAGVTRTRLESFDRPIRAAPEYFPDKRDALLREFRNYLGILKAVHSGADLQASAAAVGASLPGGARGYLGYVTSHIGDPQILPFIEAAVEARTEIAPAVAGNKDLLYLDLALEASVRQAAERGAGAAGFGAAALMAPLLQNLALSLGDNEEACFCLKAWQGLPASVRAGGVPSREEALQAVAVIGRIRRLLAGISDKIVARVAPFATALGRAAGCDPWAVDIFAEEVVRGGPAFAVSLVVSGVEPALRGAAELGAWQVISPAEVTGRVLSVPHLSQVQDEVYDDPTVLVVDTVTGEEEIPEGAVAVLTPDAPDVLSHVSVRARNMRVLFATCHDAAPLDEIRASEGQYLHFKTTAAGAVTWVSPSLMSIDSLTGSAAGGGGGGGPGGLFGLAAAALGGNGNGAPRALKVSVPKWCGRWAVGMDEFAEGVVGAKSRNLANLRGRLPEWVRLPPAVTVPFGSFERALDEPDNRDAKRDLQEALKELRALPKHALTPPPPPTTPGPGIISSSSNGSSSNGNGSNGASSGPAAILARCREAAMRVKVPRALREQLAAKMAEAGIPVPDSEERWAQAEAALRGVWASKYNDRAFYSLRKVGVDADDVRMAVCVMRVVPARYAFVIHTKNPQNGDAAEVFAELVKGLGEALVSGMVPGSSVAFTARKDALDAPRVLAYASKSEGMFVPESLIFRSDSNGEDLEGYAGAGLYESITMDPTEVRRVDYMADPVTADPEFRRRLMADVAKVGAAIEAALGGPQDVEGVVDPDGHVYVVQTRPQV